MTDGAPETRFRRTEHPEAQWFGTAALGLFVHWGISSVHGGIDLSWGMMADTPWDAESAGRNKVTPREYYQLAERFDPSRYDPLRWLEAARRAGFRYAVMTAKHHDGYALWPSEVGDLGVRTHLGGRDLVTPFVQACRRVGLKVGLYYSPPDWWFNRDFMSFRYGSGDPARHPGRQHYGLDHEAVDRLPSPDESHVRAYHNYVRRQVEEILTGLGRLDILWFDGPPAVIGIDEIRRLQPGIVVNPRMHGVGDFLTPECEMPGSRPEGWWELCDILPDGPWGYVRDAPYRSTGWLLGRLAQVRGWGGNYLVNVGPGPDGELPEQYYDRMEEIEAWMEHSGTSIFGVEPAPAAAACTMPLTVGADAWYVHVLPSHAGRVALHVPSLPRSVALVRGGEPVEWALKRREGAEGGQGKLVFEVPTELRTALDDVVAVRF
jgi:alpha-L-fucosidase